MTAFPRNSRLLLWALGVLWFAACGTPINDDYLRWSQVPYSGEAAGTLGEGDRISIRVYQEPDMTAEYVISPAGAINFPLIGMVDVFGRNCPAIESEITERLGDGYLRSPSVSCQVIEVNSLTFVVSGEIGAPGIYPYSNNLTLVQGIAMAGGLTASAAKDRVTISRNVDGVVEEIEVPFQQILNGRAPDMLVWPNDSVFVPTFRLIP